MTGLPPITRVIHVWRSNGITWNTVRIYRRWVRRFTEDCCRRGEVAEDQLREEIVNEWAVRYAREKGLGAACTKGSVHCALWAWSWGLQACGYAVPQWTSVAVPSPSLPPLQEGFVRFRREVRGVAESTLLNELRTVQEFLQFMHLTDTGSRRREWRISTAFWSGPADRMTPRTLTSVACVLRSFLRFLYSSGQIPHDLAPAVATPRVRRGDSPPRALPWSDVRRILRAIEQEDANGPAQLTRCC